LPARETALAQGIAAMEKLIARHEATTLNTPS